MTSREVTMGDLEWLARDYYWKAHNLQDKGLADSRHELLQAVFGEMGHPELAEHINPVGYYEDATLQLAPTNDLRRIVISYRCPRCGEWGWLVALDSVEREDWGGLLYRIGEWLTTYGENIQQGHYGHHRCSRGEVLGRRDKD